MAVMATRLILEAGVSRPRSVAVGLAVSILAMLSVSGVNAQSAPAGGVGSEKDSEVERPPQAAPSLDKIDALLNEALSAEEYREAKRCLNRRDYRDVDILNEEFLLFSKNGAYYLNRLEAKCHGMDQRMVITLTSRLGSMSGHLDRYCQHDRVYVSNRFDLRRYGFDANGRPIGYISSCALGEFEVIDEQQMLALREAL